ncbi:MAG: hypothetical protein QGG73_10260 [Candidatus Hydrogenedentes bacterium]|jgi:hypothetical protein|nr:hypothetical protein [Candidatus Hydrogenedentota bacterium]
MSMSFGIRFGFAFLAAAAVVCGLPPSQARAASHHLILSGSGGEEAYRQLFREWSARLDKALAEQLSIPAENIARLVEPLEGALDSTKSISLETIRLELENLSERIEPDEDLYVYLIGHGSHFKRDTKLHIPSRDLTAKSLAEQLDTIRARRIVLVVATSSGAGFINAVSGPNRIIASATKDINEINATEFMGFFIEGLESGSADRNRDERITILEAAHYAAELTGAWFVGEGLLATEHAILDDNGDGLGSRLPLEGLDEGGTDSIDDGADGLLAATTYLKDHTFSPSAPQESVDTYLSTLDRIFELKREKDSMESDAYYAELERLLLVAAKANRDIRRSPPAEQGSPAEGVI